MDYASRRFAQEERVTRSQLSKEKYFKKWRSLWRTIILSSLGKTRYPYSQYIQTLQLQDLEKLLTDVEFNARISQDFFQGELEHFKIDRLIQCRTPQFDVAETITEIGEDSAAGRAHRKGDESNSDQAMAAFLKGLRPQSLESFQASDCYNFGPQSFQALNYHGKSLTDLTLHVLMPHNVSLIPLLRSCTNLASLSLAGIAVSNSYFDDPTSDTFLETVAWLRECKQLRVLTLRNFSGAYTLMTHILSDDCIQLKSLLCEGDPFRNTGNFLTALADQLSLRNL
ncbi:hypothetical protein MMC22_001487 [Lobaria immixta]|nr:hypothetical protein [Lobaria immixta]